MFYIVSIGDAYELGPVARMIRERLLAKGVKLHEMTEEEKERRNQFVENVMKVEKV